MPDLLRGEKFQGWRVTSLPAGWDKSGVQEGDIVKTVNGEKLETPEQLFDVWWTLATVDAAKVQIDRGGKPVEVVVTIVGGPGKAKKPVGPPGPPPKMAPNRTKTILDEEPPAED